MNIVVVDQRQLESLGQKLGQLLRGGETIELVGDVGTGKTTLTKAIGVGLAIEEDVQSPSFTISRQYEARDGLRLHHYDFYRLHDAGIMTAELAETMQDETSVTIIEWADVVAGVLPEDRMTIRITPHGETGRELEIIGGSKELQAIAEKLG